MLNSRKWMMNVEVLDDETVQISILRHDDLKLEIECATIETQEGFQYTSGGEYGVMEFDGDIEVDGNSITFGREQSMSNQ
ncbi:MAG: hypothetical protein OXC13_08430 [Caldilineaceae bacterium]|nr:hypothetical protein [Caldilineaceae bacterium]